MENNFIRKKDRIWVVFFMFIFGIGIIFPPIVSATTEEADEQKKNI